MKRYVIAGLEDCASAKDFSCKEFVLMKMIVLNTGFFSLLRVCYIGAKSMLLRRFARIMLHVLGRGMQEKQMYVMYDTHINSMRFTVILEQTIV